MKVGQGFGVWGFCRCVAGLFPFHYDAGSALLGGGLDAFVTCFLSGLFLTAEADPINGSAWLYEDMMMAFCFLYFLIQSAMFVWSDVQSRCTYKYITVSGTDRHFLLFY